MGYVGNQTTNAYSSMDKQTITGDGGASYTLTHAVANAQEIEVFVNNVRQEAGVAYTVNGTALNMTGNVASTDDFYVIYQGKALQTVVPPDGSVTSAKLVYPLTTFSSTGIDDNATSTAMTLDSSGNVGIGTTSPNNKLEVSTASATNGITSRFTNTGSTGAGLQFLQSGVDTFEMTMPAGSGGLRFIASGTNERMRIDSSGRLLIGTTSANSGYGNNNAGMTLTASGSTVFSNSSGDYGLVLNKTAPQSGSTYYQINFRSANVNVGGIFTNASSTTYATTSDYRLKENVTDITGATERLKQLNPVRFNFIADADTTVDGFLAHEVQDVVPEAITGTKDAVDDDGNPVYQNIDQSKLVPLLVATIQELEARIAALEAN